MAISLESIRTGIAKDAPIITIFGDGGIGKTSFCANAPAPIFIFTEKSLGKLDVPRFTYTDEDGSERYIANTFEEVMISLSQLLGNHNYKTVVIDSLDWLEPLVENYLFRMRPTNSKGKVIKNIKDYGYNDGPSFAMSYWKEYFDLLTEIQKKKDMIILQTAHRAVVKMTPPDSDAYTAYNIKLESKAREKIIEGSDVVLYASTKLGLTQEELGFNQTRNRAVGSGDRYVYTQERPSHEGKNKYSLPYEIAIKDENWSELWSIMAAHIPWFKQFNVPTIPTPNAEQTANIANLITQGA
jgi:AAA domain